MRAVTIDHGSERAERMHRLMNLMAADVRHDAADARPCAYSAYAPAHAMLVMLTCSASLQAYAGARAHARSHSGARMSRAQKNARRSVSGAEVRVAVFIILQS